MLVRRRKINFARAFKFGLSYTSHWLGLACQTLLLTVASASAFSISGEAFAQSVTNYFALQIKLQDKAAEPSRVRDAAIKALGKEFELSRFIETYELKGTDVVIKSEIGIAKALGVFGGIDRISHSSSFSVRDRKPNFRQTVEQRGSRGDVYTAVYDRRKKKIQYTKNRFLVKEEPIDGDVIDLVGLPYYWFGAKVEAKEVRLHVTDARTLYRDELFTAVEFSADVLGQKQQLIKFTRKPKTANTDVLEIWSVAGCLGGETLIVQ